MGAHFVNVLRKHENTETRKHSFCLLSLHPSGVLRMDGGGGETNSGMFVKPNILNSIMIPVPNIWGVEIYFWIVYKAQHFQFYPDICVKHSSDGTIFLGFSFYPDIRAKYLGGGNIFLGNVYNPMFFILS